MGICPRNERRALLKKITDPGLLGRMSVGQEDGQDIAFNRGKEDRMYKIVPAAMLYPASYVCRAFFEEGLDREAVQLMRDFWSPHDYLPQFPEGRIQGDDFFMVHEHGSGIGYLMVSYVVGLQSRGRGWSKTLFEPHPGGLGKAAGSVKTPHGIVKAAWQMEGDSCHMSIDVPEGIEVQVQYGNLDEKVTGPANWTGNAI